VVVVVVVQCVSDAGDCHVVGTRLGRQSNSVKLTTLLQHQSVSTGRTRPSVSNSRTRPARLSESSVDDTTCAWNDRYHGDNFGDDQSDGSGSLPTATRSNSDASSLCSVWRQSRRRRSDTDSSHLIERPHTELIDSLYMRPHTDTTQVLVTQQTTQTTERLTDQTAPHTIDSSIIEICTPSETSDHQRWIPASQLSPDTMDVGTTDQRQVDTVNQTLCSSTIDRRIIDAAVSPLRSDQRTVSSVTSCDAVTTNTAVIENVSESSADNCQFHSPQELSPARNISQGDVLAYVA